MWDKKKWNHFKRKPIENSLSSSITGLQEKKSYNKKRSFQFCGNLLIEWNHGRKHENGISVIFPFDVIPKCCVFKPTWRKKAHTRSKWLSFIWKSNFIRNTREAWTKAQSHQVEFNWLQLFNSSFFSSCFVSFAHTFQSVCPYIVCAFRNLFFYIVWVFCWKSQLRIQWSAKQSTQERKKKWRKINERKTGRKQREQQKKIQWKSFNFHCNCSTNLAISRNVQYLLKRKERAKTSQTNNQNEELKNDNGTSKRRKLKYRKKYIYFSIEFFLGERLK